MDFTGGFFSPFQPTSRAQSPAPPSQGATATEHNRTSEGNDRNTSATAATSTSAPGSSSNDEAGHDQAQVASAAAMTNPPAATTATASPTLEQELGNVMAGLGSFWGRVRKQTTEAYHTAETMARKDLTPLVNKARANLDSFGESTRAELARLAQEGGQGGQRTGVIIGADGVPIIVDEEPTPVVDVKGKGKARDSEGQDDQNRQDTTEIAAPTAIDDAAAAATAFFARMQSQVASNPNVKGLSRNLATLQHQVQNNLQQLPTSLQTNLTQLQDQFAHLDLPAAAHKGENWLSEFSHEVQRLATDAVRVVPPSEAELSTERSRKRDERMRKAEQVAVGRRDLLVMQLRQDRELLQVDPSLDDELKEAFEARAPVLDDERIAREREEGGDKLQETESALVPAVMTQETFWARYLFRLDRIDEDEERRRKVLEVAENTDEDFSWDMDEDDEAQDQNEGEQADATTASAAGSTTAARTTAPPAANLSLGIPSLSASSTTLSAAGLDTPRGASATGASTPASEADWGFSSHAGEAEPQIAAPVEVATTTSPRISSDGTSGASTGSYDVVGERSGAPSERDETEVVTAKAQQDDEEEEDDSDWE